MLQYLLKYYVEIEFLEKNLKRLFFFFFLGFPFFIFFIYFFKIGQQKKKLLEKTVTNILPILLLSICILQRILIEYNEWEFFELEAKIKFKDKKIRDLKKEIKDLILWKENRLIFKTE